MLEATRREVRERANSRCEYCRLPAVGHEQPFSVDHVIARKHGGGDELGNLALACLRCNLLKGTDLTTLDAGSGDLIRLFNPRLDVWEDHFVVEGTSIHGTTPTGRATVSLLKFNAPERLALRNALREEGLCP